MNNNITTISLKITFRNGHWITRDNITKFMTQYSDYLECDYLSLFYIKGKEVFILNDIIKIEVR